MLPFSSIHERFEDILRFAVIIMLMLCLCIADVIALPSPFDPFSHIPFMVITVFYWALYRPTFLPVIAVFVIGLFLDSLGGGPLGFNAMILVLVHWAISSQRAFLLAQPFPIIWLVFAVVSFAILTLQWLVLGLVELHWIAVAELLPKYIAGLVAFPFLALLLYFAHKVLPNKNLTLTSR